MRLASHGLVIIDHGYLTLRTLLHDSWKALQSNRCSDPQHTGVGDCRKVFFKKIAFSRFRHMSASDTNV